MPTFELDISLARVMSAMSHWLGVQAGVAGSIMAGATAIVAFRSGLPRWYAWTSAVVAVLSALTVVLIVPLFLFGGWVALTATFLQRWQTRQTAALPSAMTAVAELR